MVNDQTLKNLVQNLCEKKKAVIKCEDELETAYLKHQEAIKEINDYIKCDPDLFEYEIFGNGVCFYDKIKGVIFFKFDEEE